MESIAGLYRIRCRTPSLRSACFVASRFFPHLINCCRDRLLSALRLAGRVVSSSRPVPPPIQSNMRCGFGCLLAVAGDDVDALSSRHLVISSCGSALRFLLACGSSRLCRLISSASHLIVRRLACLLPVLRHGWAGREAGSVGVLLAWFLPCGLCRCR